MLFGIMNNPEKDIITEIVKAVRHKFDFIEITIESPGARPERNWQTIKEIIERNKLKVIGSIDYNLQIASPWVPIRKAAIMQAIRAFPVFEVLGVEFAHIHLDDSAKYEKENMFKWNSETLNQVCTIAAEHGVKIMVENSRLATKWQFDLLSYVLEKNRSAYFNLDVGHANLGVKHNLTSKLLKFFGQRLAHVHISDNNGIEDQHLELGKGKINWKEIVRALKSAGYDGTITLETFNPGDPLRAALRSREYFSRIWKEM